MLDSTKIALKKCGFETIKDYLKSLAQEYNVPYYKVALSYQMLGESELFDGLINVIEDASKDEIEYDEE
jgi:hypothetical protein